MLICCDPTDLNGKVKVAMEKAEVCGDSHAELIPVYHPGSAPLSAEAEADLRRLAQKWATLLKDAETFEQPIRSVMLFVRSFGDPLPETAVKMGKEGQKRRKKVR
jgi:hypothetical protein